jgi:hypothetical protein
MVTLRIDVYHHAAHEDDDDNSSLTRILMAVTRLEKKMAALDEALTALTQKVTDENTVIDGAIVFIGGIPALIKSAVDAALAQGATPTQLQAMTDLGTSIQNKKDALAAALVAGTPSAYPSSRIGKLKRPASLRRGRAVSVGDSLKAVGPIVSR